MTTSPFADEFDAFSPFAPEATGLPVVSESPEQATVRQAVARGTTDLNALTNLVFFARHPERSGRGLSASEPGFAALGAEWTTIRDTVVRPLLSPTPSAPTTTADLWVPGAERVANAKSAGGTYVDGPWRFVFHTIEGEPSAQGFRTLAAGHGNPPHLWAMPSADLLLQTVPLHRSAYALARPGATMTNRLHAIQVECWGFAAKMGAATADTLNWLADRVLAPVARMVPINLDGLRPIGPGEPCYGTHSGCRMTAAEWQAFDGVCGHKDVPDNEHWDPGQLPIPTIAARAKATLGGTGSIRRESPVADLAGLSSHDGPNFVAERDDEDTESPWQQEAADVHPRLAWEAPSAEADPWAEFDHLAPAGFVPPVPARPPMTRRPSMFDRGCCLLVSRSLTGVDKLKDRWGTGTYDRSQPGTLYTGKAGFVDLAHLWSVAEVTAYAYQQIYAAGGKRAPRSAPSRATRRCAARRRRRSGWGWRAASPTTTRWHTRSPGTGNRLAGAHNSAFSPEDLCSNYLGTVVAARALLSASATPRTTFVGEAETQLRLLLTSLDAQTETETKKAFALISRRWVDETQVEDLLPGPKYLRRRNFSPVPWLAGHPSDGAVPAWIGVPFTLTTRYDYRHPSGFGLADFTPLTQKIRADAILPSNYGPQYDQP